jgi:hypothetical protein
MISISPSAHVFCPLPFPVLAASSLFLYILPLAFSAFTPFRPPPPHLPFLQSLLPFLPILHKLRINPHLRPFFFRSHHRPISSSVLHGCPPYGAFFHLLYFLALLSHPRALHPLSLIYPFLHPPPPQLGRNGRGGGLGHLTARQQQDTSSRLQFKDI